MKDGITKGQSKAIQGMAILMMLYHHLFSVPEALGVEYKSLLTWSDVNAELSVACFFKICVGLYAFVSGYGLFRSTVCVHKDRDSFFNRLLHDYKLVVKKLLAFYTQYWLVFIIFMAVGFFFFKTEFDIKEFLLNFLGISSSYNGAWWYVLQYVKMLLLFPLINCFFEKIRDRLVVKEKVILYGLIALGFIGLFLFSRNLFVETVDFFKPAFMLCFVSGYLVSRFGVYEWAGKLLPEKAANILGILSLIIVVFVRIFVQTNPYEATFDFILVPFFVWGVVSIFKCLRPAETILAFFGKYSTYMWLCHVFFYDKYAKNIVMLSRFSTGIYFSLVLLSLIASVCLTFLYDVIVRKHICRKK